MSCSEREADSAMESVTLFRPTTPRELALLRDGGFLKWPQRLGEQPLFYPMTNEQAANAVTRAWTVRHGGVAYVSKFQVRLDSLDRSKTRQVRLANQDEWSIAAEDVDALNRSIVGRIRVVSEFRA